MPAKRRYSPTRRKPVVNINSRHSRGTLIHFTGKTAGRGGQLVGYKAFARGMVAMFGGAWAKPRKR